VIPTKILIFQRAEKIATTSMMGRLLGYITLEMVGHGNQHDCCALHGWPGDLICLKREVMEVIYQQEGDPEPDTRFDTVMKAVIIRDGVEVCTVGFLPLHVACMPQKVVFLHRKFAQILELYADDPKNCMRANKSRHNHGMVSYRLLDDIPERHQLLKCNESNLNFTLNFFTDLFYYATAAYVYSKMFPSNVHC
jgi:hypothetical protein